MKNVLKQSGKALCYFGAFFGSQIIFSIILILYHSVMLGVEFAQKGEMPDNNTLNELLLERVYGDSGLLVILAAVLTIFALWLFFFVRKKKLTVEAEIVPFDKKLWVPVIGMGIGMALFFNGGMSLLPIPEDVLASYTESSAGLFEQPFLLALISNAIAAPLVEEIVFRGLMNTRMRKAMPTVVVVLITSVVFGLMHGHILWASYAAVMGILFAIVAIKCNSTLASIIVHLLVNLIGTLFSFSGWLPTTMEYAIMCGVGVIFLVFSMLLLFKKKEQ